MTENSLAQSWAARLAVLEAQLQVRPEAAFVWHARIEAKVLRFLVARYPDGRNVVIPSVPETFVSPLAVIASPKKRPLKRQRMKLLHHIAQVNRAVRDAKLSPFEQFYENFDRHIEGQLNKSREEREQRAQMKERQRQFAQRMRDKKQP